MKALENGVAAWGSKSVQNVCELQSHYWEIVSDGLATIPCPPMVTLLSQLQPGSKGKVNGREVRNAGGRRYESR
ncbi:hypothetical protein GN956_G12803 [Arapaima gigas]